MSADNKLAPENAFDPGAQLWVVSAEQNEWWQEIDFQSGFLMSNSVLFQKAARSVNIETIISETDIRKITVTSPKKSLLLGTEDHFANRWVLVVPDSNENSIIEIADTCNELKVHSVRFFSFPKDVIKKVSTRLSTSLNHISFIE